MTTAIQERRPQSPHRQQMTRLCRTFHVLLDEPGTDPWDQDKFAAWASAGQSGPTRLAAAFVLSVWNNGQPEDGGWWNEDPYSVGRFDVFEAMARWDASNKSAFLAWCMNPFWP